MHTYSHLIQTAWLRQALRNRGLTVPGSFVIGSLAPDVPLLVLTVIRLVSLLRSDVPGQALFGHEYDALYFGDPLWIIGHSAMHAPPAIVAGLALGFGLAVRFRSSAWKSLGWFWSGCAIHSALDIATHTYDGPLLLFPFDWQLRFESPVSYWDPRHYGRVVMPIEHLLDIAAATALLSAAGGRWRERLQSRRKSGQTDQAG